MPTSNVHVASHDCLADGSRRSDWDHDLSQISPADRQISLDFALSSRMAPVRIDLHQLQPFKAVRENWCNVRPYYINYVTAINFGNILTSFIAIVEQIVSHGFKFPRLHPELEVEELTLSFEHPNEIISAEELTAAQVFEIEEWERWRIFCWISEERTRVCLKINRSLR